MDISDLQASYSKYHSAFGFLGPSVNTLIWVKTCHVPPYSIQYRTHATSFASSSFGGYLSPQCGCHLNMVPKVPVCKCDDGYLDWEGKPCTYAQKSKLTAFLLSFFIGGLGADWFYLAQGGNLIQLKQNGKKNLALKMSQPLKNGQKA